MKRIFVYADWVKNSEPILIGTLMAVMSRGNEIFSFEYDYFWLSSSYVQILDPDLQLFIGPQYVNNDKLNFGVFQDSAPDRWGRTLMQRREALEAIDQNRNIRKLQESDYLLGVHDLSRLGGLRYALTLGGPFLDDRAIYQAPPIAHIRKLEVASMQIEDNNVPNTAEENKWLKMLVGPGSSLGGARPKATVTHTDGSLWIAKFPSKQDDRDWGKWEYIVSILAAQCGIQMSLSESNQYTDRFHTFLTKRFDRQGDARIHYASAMTLLGYEDGNNAADGISYLEMIEMLERFGAQPTHDIRALWKRIVFSVAISNTDDHLRNHGFLLTPKGWVLSPAFDINPNPDGLGLSLNISEHSNELSFALCIEVSTYFRWSRIEAEKEIKFIVDQVSKWDAIAKDQKLSRSEIERMKSAFNTHY